jgi:hypothetical protein
VKVERDIWQEIFNRGNDLLWDKESFFVQHGCNHDE